MSETKFSPDFLAEFNPENDAGKSKHYEQALLALAEQEFHGARTDIHAGQSANVWFGQEPESQKDICFKSFHTEGLELGWLNREFEMLEKFRAAGVRVPRPIAHIPGRAGSTFNESGLLAMERISGRSLEQELQYRETQQKPFTAQELQAIIDDASQQIKLAHQAHLYHRDLHLNNVMLNEGGKVVFIDLGKAYHALGAEDDLDIYRGSVVRDGHRVPVGYARDDGFIGRFSKTVMDKGLLKKKDPAGGTDRAK